MTNRTKIQLEAAMNRTAEPFAWLAGPDSALPPSENWVLLPAGETHWYAFDYQGHLEAGRGKKKGETVWIGSQIHVLLDAQPDSGAAFSIWTPAQVRRWALGEEVEPVGRGTRNELEPGDLFWSGNFAAPDRYFIVVEHRGSEPSRLKLSIRSKGVFVPTVRQTAQNLQDEGYGAVAIGEALRVLGQDAQAAGQTLKDLAFPAIGVGQALKDAFGLDGTLAGQILKDVGFPAFGVGQALKDVFGLDAQAAAQVLKDVAFSAEETALVLRDPNGYNIQYAKVAVGKLKEVGFNAAETYEALKVVYLTEMDEAEEILIAVGYSSDDAFEAVRDDLLAWYSSLTAQFGPVLYLHTEEKYQPSSVDWFIDRTKLVAQLPGGRVSERVSASNLMERVDQLETESGATKFWFDTDTFPREGDLSTALSYVHAVRLRQLGKTDLQYWFFYPYNGPGTAYLRIGEIWDNGDDADDHGNFAPIGEHAGDWEAVILRFDNATKELDGAYMSQHGDYPFYPKDQLEFHNGHVAIYSSLNGHANFPKAGKNPHRERHDSFVFGHFDLDTLNWADKGKSLKAYEQYEIVAVDDQILPSTSWMNFPGNWGPSTPNPQWDSDKAREIAYGYLAPAVAAAGSILGPILDAVLPDIINSIVDATLGWGGDSPGSPARRGTEWMYTEFPDEPTKVTPNPTTVLPTSN